MDRYYIRYSAPNRSYSVIDRHRTNDFGNPYVVTPLVTEREAREISDRLNAGCKVCGDEIAAGRLCTPHAIERRAQLAAQRVWGDVVTNNPNMR